MKSNYEKKFKTFNKIMWTHEKMSKFSWFENILKSSYEKKSQNHLFQKHLIKLSQIMRENQNSSD